MTDSHSADHDHDHDHGHEDGRAHGASHAHGHSHGQGHAHGAPNLDRAFAIGIAINLAFVVVEAFYGWKADSLALLADAGHNLGDVLGLVLAWAGAFAGRLAPDERHTYGWKRASILAAFANSLLLLVAIGSLAWAAIGRLAAPAPIDAGIVMVVAAIGIVVNGATALLFLRGRHGDLNARAAFLHMAADAAVSLGVVIAGAVMWLTGAYWIDPAISLLIVVVILVGTWGLLRESVKLALNAVPQGVDLPAVADYLAHLPGVSAIHDLHIWGMSTTQSALTVHLVMPAGYPGDAAVDAISQALRERFAVQHSTLQVEQGTTEHACSLHKAPGVSVGPTP